jgi:hypothetical protein
MNGLDFLLAQFSHPPSVADLTQEEVEDKNEGVINDDDEAPVIPDDTAVESASELPFYVQQAIKAIGEKQRETRPTIDSIRYLADGSGAIASINESKLSYSHGLWLVNQRAVRLAQESWWLPNINGDADPVDIVILKVVSAVAYEICRKRKGIPKEAIERKLLVVIGAGADRRASLIADVQADVDSVVGARYVASVFGIPFDPEDLVAGKKIRV